MKTHIAIRFVLASTFWSVACTHAAVLTNWVYNTNNFGPGSLYAAITNANANSLATNYIYFNITTNESGPATGPFTIRPASQLPRIDVIAILDGYTQSGAAPNTLAVGNDARLMIELGGSTTPGGTDGLRIANRVTVRGLVINRFNRHGIYQASSIAPGGVVQGCFIGTDTNGTVALGNGGVGINLQGVSSVIGGTNAADRNVVAGNSGHGVVTWRSGNLIQGNYIGTDKTGLSPLGNNGFGVQLSASTTIIGSTNNPVAGRNVIAANNAGGIDLGNEARNTVVGNYIGTDANGSSFPAFANNGPGVIVSGGNSNLIGGIVAGYGNLITGNAGNGVVVNGEVQPGFFTNGWANAILGNSIFSNGILGIDLQLIATPGGVTANDACDLDYDGGNRYQNFPTLTSASSTTSNITIAGTLNSATNTNYLLEFFASSQCDPSGFGEGETFIGRTNLTAGADCTNAFSFTFPVAVADGKFLTATASRVLLTNAVYETSEFSQCIINAGPAGLPVVTIISTTALGNNLCLSWTAPGGTTSFVQAAPSVTGLFTNISGPLVLPPGPQSTTNYCDVGTLTNASVRWYRIAVQN